MKASEGLARLRDQAELGHVHLQAHLLYVCVYIDIDMYIYIYIYIYMSYVCTIIVHLLLFTSKHTGSGEAGEG